MNKFKKPTLFKIPKFDLNYLTDIKNEENSCVIAKRTKLHLNFHPLHLTDFMASLKEILNQKITRYSKEYVTTFLYFKLNCMNLQFLNCRLGGILLGYDDVKVMSNLGVINDDSCFIHVDIEGNFFIFTPAVGQHLHGTVNKINKSHISCLVYDCFTVTVPLSDDEAWLENELQNGENVLLKIVSVNLRCKLPYIKAQIVYVKVVYLFAQ